MIRTVAVVVVVLATSLPWGGSARAMSCACTSAHPAEILQGADAAFVGTAVSVRELPQPRPRSSNTEAVPANPTRVFDWRFRVDEVLKGPLGSEVVVRQWSGECGRVRGQVGERTGFFLYRKKGAWTAPALCSDGDPLTLLRRAAAPLPPSTARLPPRFLIGGAYGGFRTIALDRVGRIAGYGVGEGEIAALSVCPGSRRVVEVVRGVVPNQQSSVALAVRDLYTLAVVNEWRLPLLEVGKGRLHPAAVSCRDAAGHETWIFAERGSDRAAGKVLRVRAGQSAVVFEGPTRAVSFPMKRNVAYVVTGKFPEARSLVELNVRSGGSRVVTTLPPQAGSLVLSPGETKLAGTNHHGGLEWWKGTIFLIDLRTGRVSTRLGFSAQPIWIDEQHFALFPAEERVRVYDSSLRVSEAWKQDSASDPLLVHGLSGPYQANFIVVDGKLYGTAAGTFVSAPKFGAQLRVLRQIGDPELAGVLAYVPPPPTKPTSGVLWALVATIVAFLALAGAFAETRRGAGSLGSASTPK